MGKWWDLSPFKIFFLSSKQTLPDKILIQTYDGLKIKKEDKDTHMHTFISRMVRATLNIQAPILLLDLQHLAGQANTSWLNLI